MRYSYYFCQLYNSALANFLDESGIKYKVTNAGKVFSNGTPVPSCIIFTLKGYSETIEKLIHDYRCDPRISIEYSQAEINQAELLVMTPKRQSVEVTNPDSAYQYTCTFIDSRGIERAHHKQQIGKMEILKEPSFRSQTAIWASLDFSEIFIDKQIVEMVMAGAFTGFDFDRVVLSNRMYSENIFQLRPKILIEKDCIDVKNGCVELSCPICGKKQYGLHDTFQLRLFSGSIVKQSDFFVTERIFGHGIAQPLYLVSQRFYQELKKNKLAANVRFDPVVLINLE